MQKIKRCVICVVCLIVVLVLISVYKCWSLRGNWVYVGANDTIVNPDELNIVSEWIFNNFLNIKIEIDWFEIEWLMSGLGYKESVSTRFIPIFSWLYIEGGTTVFRYSLDQGMLTLYAGEDTMVFERVE